MDAVPLYFFVWCWSFAPRIWWWGDPGLVGHCSWYCSLHPLQLRWSAPNSESFGSSHSWNCHFTLRFVADLQQLDITWLIKTRFFAFIVISAPSLLMVRWSCVGCACCFAAFCVKGVYLFLHILAQFLRDEDAVQKEMAASTFGPLKFLGADPLPDWNSKGSWSFLIFSRFFTFSPASTLHAWLHFAGLQVLLNCAAVLLRCRDAERLCD